MSSFLVDMMKELQDRRLFYYAEPAPRFKDAPADSFDSYSGVNPVLEYGLVQAEFAGDCILISMSVIIVCPKENLLNLSLILRYNLFLAEAALRGWKTPATARQHYENGVRAAMLFTFEHTPEAYRHGVTIDEAYINEYLSGKANFDESKGLSRS